MPSFAPIKRRALIRFLRQAGFEGPYSGGRHQFMIKEEITLRLPNPHQGDIGKEFRISSLASARSSVSAAQMVPATQLFGIHPLAILQRPPARGHPNPPPKDGMVLSIGTDFEHPSSAASRS